MARKAKRRRAAKAIDWQGRAEDLRFQLVTVEALAHAAEEALAGLPYVRDRRARFAIGRVYALVCATAKAAREAKAG